MTFTVGSKVAWTSQAHASVVEKHGEVVAVVPAGENPNAYIPQSSGYPQFDGGSRKHESYLVRVRTGKDGRGVAKLYWPRVSAMVEG